MTDCVYPNCYSCKFPYCIKEDEEKIKKTIDRKEYHKKRYQEHKEEIRENYKTQKQYIRWVEVKKTINGLKKQIGLNNFELIMSEIEKLDKHTLSNML